MALRSTARWIPGADEYHAAAGALTRRAPPAAPDLGDAGCCARSQRQRRPTLHLRLESLLFRGAGAGSRGCQPRTYRRGPVLRRAALLASHSELPQISSLIDCIVLLYFACGIGMGLYSKCVALLHAAAAAFAPTALRHLTPPPPLLCAVTPCTASLCSAFGRSRVPPACCACCSTRESCCWCALRCRW